MGTRKIERQQLLDSAGYLFRVQGYRNTSMGDIAKQCSGINKASLYHYFESKQALAVGVLQDLHRVFEELFFAPLRDTSKSIKERAINYAKTIEEFFIGRESGCLMANIALEVGDTIPEFTEVLQNYFQAWIDAVFCILKDRFPEQKARELATDLLSQLQGAIMLSNLYKDYSHLKRHHAQLLALLEE